MRQEDSQDALGPIHTTTRLVYVGGYGRSGSTLLEYLMTANTQVLACGEVASALRKTKKTCTCGYAVMECPIWSRHLCSAGKRWSHKDLVLALLDNAAGKYELMVDSSKTAWGSMTMPFRLRRRLGPRFHLIHLVRDPRGVCWSLIQSKRSHSPLSQDGLTCIRSAIGWWFANFSCECFRWLYPNQYSLLFYEDLARSPSEVLEATLRDLLPHVPWTPGNMNTSLNRHQLQGNRMRNRPLSFDEVSPDVSWKYGMPPVCLRITKVLCWPLRGRYGYS